MMCPQCEAGLAALRLILAGTFDRHPDLQVILGHWGEMLVPFADRADLLSAARTPGAVSAGATAPASSSRPRRSTRRTRPSSLT
jgi:predicted TIM-barrel fold metal-dependent hydrolase